MADFTPAAATRTLRNVPCSSLIWHLLTSLPSAAVSARNSCNSRFDGVAAAAAEITVKLFVQPDVFRTHADILAELLEVERG